MSRVVAWVPNALGVFRLLLAVPIVVVLLDRQYGTALALVALAGVSDVLDGYIAKRFDCQSRFGSLLDPAADKLLLTSVFVSLTAIGLVPLALTAIVVGRDVVIVLGVIAWFLVIGPVDAEPAVISKLNTVCQTGFALCAIGLAAYGLPPENVVGLLGAAVVFTSITSGMYYVLGWGWRAWRSTHAAA